MVQNKSAKPRGTSCKLWTVLSEEAGRQWTLSHLLLSWKYRGLWEAQTSNVFLKPYNGLQVQSQESWRTLEPWLRAVCLRQHLWTREDHQPWRRKSPQVWRSAHTGANGPFLHPALLAMALHIYIFIVSLRKQKRIICANHIRFQETEMRWIKLSFAACFHFVSSFHVTYFLWSPFKENIYLERPFFPNDSLKFSKALGLL